MKPAASVERTGPTYRRSRHEQRAPEDHDREREQRPGHERRPSPARVEAPVLAHAPAIGRRGPDRLVVGPTARRRAGADVEAPRREGICGLSSHAAGRHAVELRSRACAEVGSGGSGPEGWSGGGVR